MAPSNDPNSNPQRRVFDIAGPRQATPSPTSRPIIVGHQPQAADPMVNQRPAQPQTLKPVGDAIPVNHPTTPTEPKPTPPPTPQPEPANPLITPEPTTATISPEPTTGPEPDTDMPSTDSMPAASPFEIKPVAPVVSPTDGHIVDQPTAEKHTTKPKPEHENFKLNWWVLGILIVLGALIGAYLAVDSGLIKGASHLPFHIFKQADNSAGTTSTTPTSVSLSTAPTGTATTPTIPADWKSLSLTNEKLSLKHPSTWSVINRTSDSANKNSDGTVKGDDVTVAATKNFRLNIQAGAYTATDVSQFVKLGEDTVTLAGGQAAKLTLYGTSSSSSISLIVLTATNGAFFNTKNVVMSGQAKGILNVTITDTPGGLPVTNYANDELYKDAKLVIQSLTY